MNRRLLSFAIIFFLSLALLYVSAAGAASGKPASLTFAYEDTNSFPWVFDNNGQAEGLDIELIRLLETKLNVRMNLVPYPWNRALTMMRSGSIDGVIGSSFKADRLAMGAYPTKTGASSESSRESDIDAAKRIHTSGYSLYRLKGTNIRWDGTEMVNLGDRSVAAQAGFTITQDLKKIGVAVKEIPDDPNLIFRGLIKKYFAAAAVQTTTADYIFRKNREYRNTIEKCSANSKPFHQKPYYLMLSFQLVRQYPALAADIWKNIEEIRRSEAYRARIKNFFTRFTANPPAGD